MLRQHPALIGLEVSWPGAAGVRQFRWPRLAMLMAGGCIAWLAGGAADARPPATRARPAAAVCLPNYDVRRDDPRVRQRIALHLARRSTAARDKAASRLLAVSPQARVDWHPVFGTPAYLGSTVRPLTEPMPPGNVDAVAIVTGFVGRHRELFGIEAVELATARLSRDFLTRHNQVRHVTFQQRHAGIEVFGALLRSSVTRYGEIVSIGSTVLDRPPSGFDVPTFALSAGEAIRLAAADIGLRIRDDHQPLWPPTGPERRRLFAAAPGLAGPIELRRIYFPLTVSDLRPAWEVVLSESGVGNVYEIIIDAADGAVLRRWNRLHRATADEATYRVYVSDSPAPGSPGRDTPDGFQFAFVARELLTVGAEDIAPFSPAGWIDDELDETLGNNVDAHTDLDNDDDPDLPRPSGGPERVFDFPADPQTQDPSDFCDASVVQLFFLCNIFHDRLYELGFNEAAHNFQQDNFGQGGTGGDLIQADAQDGGGFDGATFATSPADGSEARLQMYVFPNPNPSRDSDLDSELVFHELAHGVSIRLVEGLDGAQPQGLGEGWSDFLAIALNAEPDDDPHGTYPFAAYVAYELWPEYYENYYFGLRRFPYSTDPNKNPQTYADIDPEQQFYPPEVPRNPHVPDMADEPHNAGEVWCMALMQCRANLIDRYGFAGNQLMMQLVIDGMKLAVSNPNYLQARDAILQADLVNNGGANLGELWDAFAARGLGFSAVSPSTGSGGIVEAFDTPVVVVFSYPQGLPTTIPPATGATVTVQVYGLGGATPVPGTGQLHYSIDGEPFTTVDMIVVRSDTYEATLPAAACLSNYDYYFSVEDGSREQVTDPPAAPAVTFQAVAATANQVILSHDFEAEAGWTVDEVGDDDAMEGKWNRMDPEGTFMETAAVQPEDDHTPSPGTVCWVTDGLAGEGAGAHDVDDGKTTLTTPTFAVWGQSVTVSYWRWYSNSAGSSPHADLFVVSISNDDGATWHVAETVGPDGPETAGGWFYHEFSVADVVSPTEQMKVRFVASDEDESSLVEAAVDDFKVTVFLCPGDVPGDFDGDGDVDLDDHAALLDCLAGPGQLPDPAPPAGADDCLVASDFDADADVDLADFAAFQTVLPAP